MIEVNRDVAMQLGLVDSATRECGLLLGDRLCLALAAREGRPVLTRDRSWTKLVAPIGIRAQMIR